MSAHSRSASPSSLVHTKTPLINQDTIKKYEEALREKDEEISYLKQTKSDAVYREYKDYLYTMYDNDDNDDDDYATFTFQQIEHQQQLDIINKMKKEHHKALYKKDEELEFYKIMAANDKQQIKQQLNDALNEKEKELIKQQSNQRSLTEQDRLQNELKSMIEIIKSKHVNDELHGLYKNINKRLQDLQKEKERKEQELQRQIDALKKERNDNMQQKADENGMEEMQLIQEADDQKDDTIDDGKNDAFQISQEMNQKNSIQSLNKFDRLQNKYNDISEKMEEYEQNEKTDIKEQQTEYDMDTVDQYINEEMIKFKKLYNETELKKICQRNPADLLNRNINSYENNIGNIMESLNAFTRCIENTKLMINDLSSPKESEYKVWNINTILMWIASIENERFIKYLDILRDGFTKSEITKGEYLPDLDVATLSVRPFNINSFPDKRDLVKKFKELRSNEEVEGDTIYH